MDGSLKRLKRKTGTASFATKEASFETTELRRAIRQFFRETVDLPPGSGKKATLQIGQCTFGVYAFYDYDREPIYVGKTYEGISDRIGRHLTGQRSDAVAKGVLDPFEVYEVEVWPLPQYQGVKSRTPPFEEAKRQLDALEAVVYRHLLKRSRFKVVLNEKIPIVSVRSVPLPKSYRQVVVSDEVYKLRGHVDVRIARRAQTVARLAQVISERAPSRGLRAVLFAQAKRLLWLAEKRMKSLSYAKTNSAEDEDGED